MLKKGEIMRAIDKEFLEVKNRRTFRKSVDMNARDKDGWTALMNASFRFSIFSF
jgi:ankyrin repeat protein